MNKLKKIKYKNKIIYVFSEEYIDLAKKIIDKEVEVESILKNTKRNYVCKIKYKDESYIFKEPRNEYRIIQRKIMTLFKKGEALSTLINVNRIIDEKEIKNYSRPLIAIVQRKNGMIVYSALVMENIIEKKEKKNVDNIIELMKKIHCLKIYHGDFNPSNFLLDEFGNIRIIDTQGKRMIFGNYRAHYDMLTMKMDSYNSMIYPYEKDFMYYFVLGVKKFKKLKFIEKIKKFKYKLRDKYIR